VVQVSIVIPIYNQVAFVRAAIDSVLEQVCDFDVEVIVIDDGSTDGVISVLETYENRIYFESRSNRGQSASLNFGWSLAKGEIIGYLSADDALLPGSIQKLHTAVKESANAVAVYGDYFSIDENDKVIRQVRTKAFDFEMALLRLECPPGPGALFYKSAYDEVGGWDESIWRFPDYDFWLRMGNIGSLMRIDEKVALWRVHEGSQAFGGISFQRAEEPNAIIENFFCQIELSPKIFNLRLKSTSSALLVSGQLHARSNRYKIAFARFFRAIILDPTKLIEIRTFHLIVNAFFQQTGHRLLVAIRKHT